MKLIQLLLDRGEVPGEYEITSQLWHDRAAVTATSGTVELFQTAVAAGAFGDTNIPWGGGKLPKNRAERIHAIGAAICPQTLTGVIDSSDAQLLQYGVLVRIVVDDGRRKEKMQPTRLRYLMAGGGILPGLGVRQATAPSDGDVVNPVGQGPAGTMFDLEPPVDVDPNEPLLVEILVPTALTGLTDSYVYIGLLATDVVKA